MKLHADDFGLNQQANQAIYKLLKANKLASVSLIANMPATRQASRIIRKFPTVSVFLHLNLIEGMPIANSRKRSSLTSRSGTFLQRNILIAKMLSHKIDPAHIEHEIIAQFKRARTLGINVAGIDSHQHVHAFSPIAEIVSKHAQKKNIPYLRSFSQLKTTTPLGALKKYALKSLAAFSHYAAYKNPGLPTTWSQNQWFSFYVASWEKIDPTRIATNEVLVYHPGLPYDRIKVN